MPVGKGGQDLVWVPLVFKRKGKINCFLWPWVEVEIGEGTGKHGNQKEEKKTAAVSDQVAGGRKR